MGARKYNSDKLSFIPPNYEKRIILASTRALMRQKGGHFMGLSYIEMQLIKSYREGARFEIYHFIDSVEEAEKKIGENYGRVTDHTTRENATILRSKEVFERVNAHAIVDK